MIFSQKHYTLWEVFLHFLGLSYIMGYPFLCGKVELLIFDKSKLTGVSLR